MDDLCPRCKIRKPHDDPKAMYPDFCRECAERFTKVLDKHGLLKRLKRKKKIK